MIPRILHFCYFGLDRPGDDLRLYQYIAIRSALTLIRPDRILFHNHIEPSGPLWNLIRPDVERIPTPPPTEIHGRPLRHYAHQADVVRLRVLIQYGGIYLDLDTICHRSFDDLLPAPCVLGLQRDPGGGLGLCNAVMLANPDSPFLVEWLDRYRTFRSTGLDAYWDEHSVRIPLSLVAINSAGLTDRTDIQIEPPESFFIPSYAPIQLKDLFERVVHFPQAYCHHLWDTYSRERYLSRLTPDTIRSVDTTYNHLARPHLP